VIVLAASSNDVAPGTLGFLVVAGMGLALYFLFRSMSKHLRKVNDQARREQEATAALTDGAALADDAALTGDAGLTGDVGVSGPDQRSGRGRRQPR
jgi:hypothetical protein